MLTLETTGGGPGRYHRRTLLKAGFLGLGGLSLADLLRLQAEAAPSSARSDAAVILLWCGGGPSQLETYDMKPLAPAEIRGPLNPIKTNVPGIEVCELLPEHAKVADKFTLIRSVHHDEAAHPNGTFRFMSGFGKDQPGGPLGRQAADPCLTAVVNWALGICSDGVPVSLDLSNGFRWYGSPGDWGEIYRVPVGGRGLDDWKLNIPADRLGDRLSLLAGLDRLRGDLDREGNLLALNHFQQQAADILLSSRAHEAFDVSKEDPKLVERYGAERGRAVPGCAASGRARRSMVTVLVPGHPPGSEGKNYDWDDHAVNWDLQVAMRDRLPFYDRAVATLIDDLHQRNLHKRVLLLVTGEFGRTPRPDPTAEGRFGRDHWPSSMSMLISGGKGPLGSIIGATNKHAEYPTERLLDPDDIRATLLHHLGINYKKEIVNGSGRPVPLCYGQHLPEWAYRQSETRRGLSQFCAACGATWDCPLLARRFSDRLQCKSFGLPTYAASAPGDKPRPGACIAKQYHGPLAVGEIRIAGQIAPRRLLSHGADAVDVAGRVDALGLEQVFDHVVARLVDVGIDPMRRQVPGLQRKPHADIAAHLAHPYRLAMKHQRGEPQPQMQSLVDRSPAALQRHVLAAAEQIQRADRRVAILRAEQKRAERFQAGGQRDRFALVPARGEGAQDRFELANHDQIDRIAQRVPLALVVALAMADKRSINVLMSHSTRDAAGCKASKSRRK